MKESRLQVWIMQILLTCLVVLFAIPLIYMIVTSLQGQGFTNYRIILAHPLVPRFLMNSFIVTLSTILINYIVTSLAAFAISKLDIKAKELWMNAILIGLMIPAISLLVPLFNTVKHLGLINNYFAVIGPLTAILTPFTFLLMKNFLDDIPSQLLDASRIDGCNSFKAYFYIIIPLTKPIAMVVILWTFFNAWNEFFLPLIFMQSDTMKMVTQVPQFFSGQRVYDTGKVFAALVLISLPVIISYLSLQKNFEDGMTSGSIK